MTKNDDEEVHRLCSVLQRLHDEIGGDPLKSEALKKAGLAISLGFVRGLRPEIEEFYRGLDLPASEGDWIKAAGEKSRTPTEQFSPSLGDAS